MQPAVYVGDDRVLTVTSRGDRMYLDTRDIVITPEILFSGAFEQDTAALMDRVLRPGMVWVDVGANCGYFTLIGHKIVSGDGTKGQTFAFEISPINYRLCIDNLQLNYMSHGSRVEQWAISAEDRPSVRFAIFRKLAGNSGTVTINPERARYLGDEPTIIDVPTVTLDSYFAHRAHPPDFIKIDIEGGEFGALQGARRLIAQKPDIRLVIEWSPIFMVAQDVEPRAVAELFAELGLQCFNADDMRAMTVADLLALKGTTMLLLSRAALA